MGDCPAFYLFCQLYHLLEVQPALILFVEYFLFVLIYSSLLSYVVRLFILCGLENTSGWACPDSSDSESGVI